MCKLNLQNQPNKNTATTKKTHLNPAASYYFSCLLIDDLHTTSSTYFHRR